MKFLRYLPNFITSLRILGALCLVFVAPLSVPFFVLYTFTGITDALDGFVARKLGVTSELGSKLDSIADILLYSVMVLKIIPEVIELVWEPIWYAVGVIVAVRLAAYVTAMVKYRRFSSLHTYLSKAASMAIFITPYFYATSFFNVVCIVLCVTAFMSSLEALVEHLTRGEYRSNVKSIFEKK